MTLPPDQYRYGSRIDWENIRADERRRRRFRARVRATFRLVLAVLKGD